MSMMLMVKAFNLKVKNPIRKLILIKLADNANDKGECWPSHQYIADQCEVSRRTVIHHLNELEKSGLIRIENRFKNNSKQSNVYHLNLDTNPCEYYAHSSEESSQGSEIYSQGSEESAQGGSEESAHRISHSFEPPNEPIKESIVRFDEFWDLYLHKVNKAKAKQIWISKKLDNMADEIIEKLKHQNNIAYSRHLANKEKGYIPHPTTYLNGERWDDDLAEVKIKRGSQDLSGQDYENDRGFD